MFPPAIPLQDPDRYVKPPLLSLDQTAWEVGMAEKADFCISTSTLVALMDNFLPYESVLQHLSNDSYHTLRIRYNLGFISLIYSLSFDYIASRGVSLSEWW